MNPQAMEALATANHIRLTRARIKREVFAGELSLVDLLRDPPTETLNMPVGELIRAHKGWGPKRAAKILRRACVAETRPLGELTYGQTVSILRELKAA